MIITCPECETSYKIADTAVGSEGRTVRCTSCGHRWHVEPPAEEPEPAPIVDTPRRRVTPNKVRRASSKATVGAWLALLFLVLMVSSFVVARNEMVATFPSTAGLYQTLGLPIKVELGLELRNLETERVDREGSSILVVRGEVLNISGADRDVPEIKITLLDEAGNELVKDTFPTPQDNIPDGGSTSFLAEVADPPEEAANFSVTFALDSDQG